MKRLAVMLFSTGVCFAATWNQLRVPITGNTIPDALYRFDIVDAKPGEWVELIAEEGELKSLDEAGISYEIEIPDLESYYSSRMSGDGPFGKYYSYDEALSALDSLHDRFPGIVSERVALPNNDFDNLTWDSNTVWAIKISDNVDVEEDEPEVLYTGLHHAREPIGVNITVEWARRLCEGYGTDPLLTYLVDAREIWIVPMVNPDGYLYNELNAPGGGGMHRKNRRPPNGVDLNRNYPYMWGYDNVGSSPNAYDETYRGPDRASEPENQSIMNLCMAHDFATAVNFHSFSNLFYYPWEYIPQQCEDSLVFFDWGEAATRDCHYTVSPGATGLYLINGSAEDWMYTETNGKSRTFAVTVEVGEQFWQEEAIDAQIAETGKILIAAAQGAGVYPELEALSWSDGGDGVISAGETVGLTVQVRNMSVREHSGDLGVELETADPRVQLITDAITIPSLSPQETGSNLSNLLQVKLSPSALPDSAIPLSLKIATSTEEFVYDVVLPVGEKKVLLEDDFETTPGAAWVSDWGKTDEEARSGKYSITDSPYSGYPDNLTSYLESPSMDLRDMVTAELRFWHRHSIRQLPSAGEGQDWGVLEVKYQGSDDWITLKRYSGARLDWQEEAFNLDDYCGQEGFKVRFGMISDASLHLDGWYIDDVELTAFKGAVSSSGLHELADTRPLAGAAQTITTGQVDFAGSAGLKVEVTVYDESGRGVAWTEGVTPFSWQLQDKLGNHLPVGVYFVKTAYAGGETNRKLVVVN